MGVKISDQWLRATLETLYQSRTATRSQLIENTGFNPACISLTLQHLMTSGVLQKVGDLRSTGGRKREVLKLNSEAGYFAVVDLEASQVRFGLTNFLGDLRFRWEDVPAYGRDLDVDRIAAGVQMVLRNLGPAERGRVLAAGISYTGTMDAQGRVSACNLGWIDFPLREQLDEALGLPVFYGSESFCKILAERWLGVAQDSGNCVSVRVELGIGVGIFVDGRLLKGHSGMAGEFGHIAIDPALTYRCNCGKMGCLETVASTPNMIRRYLERTGRADIPPQPSHFAELLGKAREGDPDALAVIDCAGRYLGLALSHLVNVLNPELIVLGGDPVRGEDLFGPRIEAELRRHCLPALLPGLKLRMSSLGDDIGLKGAASLAFRSALEHPQLLKRMAGPVLLDHPEEVPHRPPSSRRDRLTVTARKNH